MIPGVIHLDRSDGKGQEWSVIMTIYKPMSWKCRDCGMTSRKEPHRRLSDHMLLAHSKVWSEDERAYVALPELTSEERAAMEAIPEDAMTHWMNGEWWNGTEWVPSA